MSIGHSAKPPAFDRELIRELACCYARAAVDAMLDESKKVTATKANTDEGKKRKVVAKPFTA